ncbi:MAG TPA: 3-hydroxyacyl-CoA dehydrogenase NAD-binding domain-containing protein [Burkholderiales bacterium]
MKQINSILILGLGVMGRGVAKGFADADIPTTVRSRRAGASAPDGVTLVTELPAACPDLVIELLPEELELKQAAYRELEQAWGDADYLIATGTSGLDLEALARPLTRPERLIALHYFMPADTVPLVEVMAGPASPREAVDRAAEVLRRAGKLPLKIYRPLIGHVVNRLQHAMLHEAYCMIAEGLCSVEDVDLAATRMLGPRMCSTGLVLQKDLSGLQVNRDSQRAIVPHLFHNRTPSPIVGELVARGESGVAAGKGFYDWSGKTATEVRGASAASLARLLEFLEANTWPEAAAFQPRSRGGER